MKQLSNLNFLELIDEPENITPDVSVYKVLTSKIDTVKFKDQYITLDHI